MAILSGISGFAEKLLNTYVQVETIQAGAAVGEGNQPSDYQHFATGEDSDGSTLVTGRLVAGVSNAALLGGVAVLVGLSVMAWVIIKD